MESDEDVFSENSSNSSGSNEESSDGAGEMIGPAIQPYQYEPDASTSEEDNEEMDEEMAENNARLQNLDWCQCENCQIMDRVSECVCCKEIGAIVDKNSEVVGERPACITQHPGFSAVCLNTWVLQTAWFQYKQQYDEPFEGPEHKKNRHIAYRQLARWCWGFLGRQVRVVLPSCAVSCIRAHFPPPGLEEDFIFEGFHHADE